MDILQLLHVSSSAFSFGFLQYPLKGNSRNKKKMKGLKSYQSFLCLLSHVIKSQVKEIKR